MKQNWMIRAEGGTLIDMFLSKGIAAIGWNELGDLSKYDKENMLNKLEEIWPESKAASHRNIRSILYRFCKEISISDRVITYDPSKRAYHIGHFISGYMYDTAFGVWPNVRKVEWEKQILRDLLTVNSKNILGSTLTLFSVPEDVFKEIDDILLNKLIKSDESEITINEEIIFDDIIEKSFEFIKDRLSRLNWDEMQRLVAGLLRAMGYKTKISAHGSDLGKDIIASPDGFGLEQPRIVVEVKHRNQPMGSHEIRSFLGGRHKDDKGLYVSTGGFTKDAKYEADRASIPLTLMDIEDLVKEILNNYEHLDIETKMLLPLTKVYWPK